MSNFIGLFSLLATSIGLLVKGVHSLNCFSCEGDMCNYHSMPINCQFPARACMRIYSTMTGRTYKAGCQYPFDICDQAQQISGEQMRCASCGGDNCNQVQQPYGPDSSPYGPVGPGPYYPGRGQQGMQPPYGQRYPGQQGYWWNGAADRSRTAMGRMLVVGVGLATMMAAAAAALFFP